MTYTFVPEKPVTRPSTVPLKSTILDQATVVEMTEHFDIRNEAGVWNSYNCLDTLIPTALCPDPTEDKTFDFASWVPGFSFAVYAGVQCNFVGLDVAEQKSEVERVFKANEGKGVERALVANRFVERTSADNAGKQVHRQAEWDAPEHLLPTATLDPRTALAVIEGYARTLYAGQPTLHVPVGLVSYLGFDKFEWQGDKMFTRLGSKVAMGGGYDPDYTTWDGTWDIYATGEVYVEKGPEVDIQTHELNGSTASAALGLDPNTSLALAERPFRVVVDCFTARVTASIDLG